MNVIERVYDKIRSHTLPCVCIKWPYTTIARYD